MEWKSILKIEETILRKSLLGMLNELDIKIRKTYKEYYEKWAEKLWNESETYPYALFTKYREENKISDNEREFIKFKINEVKKQMPSSVRKEFNANRKERYEIEKLIERNEAESAWEGKRAERRQVASEKEGKGRKGRDKTRGAGQRASRKAQKERFLELRRKLRGNKK